MGQVKGQQDKRRGEFFVDQHGREYFANIEIETGDPCEALRPYQWTAPASPDWARGLLLPPVDDRDVVRMVPQRSRARLKYQVFIDYAAWLQKWDAAYEAWQQKLHDFAKGMTGGINLIDAVNNPPPVLRMEVGAPPSPPRAMIEAAAAGDAWSLGLSVAVPRKAQAMLDELKPSIDARRTGLSGVNPFAEDSGPVAEDEDELPDFVRNAAEQSFSNAFADDALTAVVAEVSVQPKRRK